MNAHVTLHAVCLGEIFTLYQYKRYKWEKLKWTYRKGDSVHLRPERTTSTESAYPQECSKICPMQWCSKCWSKCDGICSNVLNYIYCLKVLLNLHCICRGAQAYTLQTIQYTIQTENVNVMVPEPSLAIWCIPTFINHNELAKKRCRHGAYRSVFEHYSDVIMGAMASQITNLTIVYSTVYSGGYLAVTGEFPAQMASNAENVSTWWRHHEYDNMRYSFQEVPPKRR